MRDCLWTATCSKNIRIRAGEILLCLSPNFCLFSLAAFAKMDFWMREHKRILSKHSPDINNCACARKMEQVSEFSSRHWEVWRVELTRSCRSLLWWLQILDDCCDTGATQPESGARRGDIKVWSIVTKQERQRRELFSELEPMENTHEQWDRQNKINYNVYLTLVIDDTTIRAAFTIPGQ